MAKMPSGMRALRSLPGNRLLYGDNLTLMQDMKSASVDLIYLDPPFNSQRTYNLIYRNLTGAPVPEQEEAFCDAWDMDPEKEEMLRSMSQYMQSHEVPSDIADFWGVWMRALQNSQPRLLAYLLYMSWRLVEMRRILKPTGSLYLHCDPTASHYIKVILDGIFGHQNFQSEVIWKRTSAHSSAKRHGPVHDVILFYTKGKTFTWNPVYMPYDQSYLDEFYTHFDDDGRRWRRSDLTGAGTRNGETGENWRGINVTAKGRHWAHPPRILEKMDTEGRIHWPQKAGGMPMLKRYLDAQVGMPLQDIWTDIRPIHNMAQERLGYPTQKPIVLLQRIIQASSNPGDVVFDPFAGCGTSIYAAHEAGRRWIGCDIAILSVRIVRDVLLKRYGLRESLEYEVAGVPMSVDGAKELFERDKKQFQHWAVELSGGFVNTKYSGDRGIDGRLWFETQDGLRAMVISVKGGKVLPAYVRELEGTRSVESNTELGGFICLEEPTRAMRDAAASSGMYNYQGRAYPRLQLRSIGDLLAGRGFDTPSRVQTLGWQKQGVLPLSADWKQAAVATA
ncbi:MAG: mod [Belnapia sp.]|nr:mod [Belnapia sp.]